MRYQRNPEETALFFMRKKKYFKSKGKSKTYNVSNLFKRKYVKSGKYKGRYAKTMVGKAFGPFRHTTL